MPYGSALLPRAASLEILILSRSHLWPLLLPLCSCHLHFGRPPLWDVVPSQASSFHLVCLQWLLQWLCLYLAPASCLTVPPVHGAHWSPFQGSFLSLTVSASSQEGGLHIPALAPSPMLGSQPPPSSPGKTFTGCF